MSRRNVTTAQSATLYPTPRWSVRLLLDALPDLPRGGSWCEPCCGDGSIMAAVEEVLGPGRAWTAVEINPAHAAFAWRHVPASARVIIGDAREELPRLSRQDVAITNAPFPLAVEIASAMLACASWVALLQRLDWMEGSSRRTFWTGPGRGASCRSSPRARDPRHPPTMEAAPRSPPRSGARSLCGCSPTRPRKPSSSAQPMRQGCRSGRGRD